MLPLKNIAFILFFLPCYCFSQGSLSGGISDSSSHLPLTGVNIFIASSQLGTTTYRGGLYYLGNIPAGRHILYISSLGYESKRDTIEISDQTLTIKNYTLAIAPIPLEAITVEAERDKKWPRRLERFKKNFLGETPFADSCIIENPEMISFAKNLGRLEATIDAPIIIINRALGYKITYFLESFWTTAGTTNYDGEPLFEELPPADSAQQNLWDENREIAFRGSPRHFLLSLLNHTTEEQGFVLKSHHSMDRMLRPSSGFYRSAKNFISEENDSLYLDFNGIMEVIYAGEEESQDFMFWFYRHPGTRSAMSQRSWIKLNRRIRILILPSGELAESEVATHYGHFAYERVGDLLPKDYRPAIEPLDN